MKNVLTGGFRDKKRMDERKHKKCTWMNLERRKAKACEFIAV